MRVDLRTLQPNPMRDFRIDPIDPDTVQQLRQSIEEDGFWGGVVCRQVNGIYQIGAGHHRVQAALAAGITVADVFIGENFDDAMMIRVYARENATQRGQSSTAMTGTVAAAMKFVAKGILTGSAQKFLRDFDVPTLRQRLLTDEDGLGWRVLLAFLDDIPGINSGSIQQQLANLKTSGDYARLLAEVQGEIAAEQASVETQELAREAAIQAAQTPKTFDFEGVAKHLKNPHQVDVFRGLVTQPAVQAYVQVPQQAILASRMVTHATETDQHLSGEFIRRTFRQLLHGEQQQFQQFLAGETARAERDDPQIAFERAMGRFTRHLRALTKAGQRIEQLWHDWPKDKRQPGIPHEFWADLQDVALIVNRMLQERRMQHESG